jgi:opacity protein-like surface antigen
MKKTALLLTLVVSLFSAVAAQNDPPDRHFEFFAGYSVLFTDHENSGTPLDRFSGLHGMDFSATGYFTKRFGITGDFSFHTQSHNETFTGGSAHFRTTSYNYLVGPQFRFVNNTRVTPFVRALAGVSNNRFSAKSTVPINLSSQSVTDFAMALGGGLDIRVHKRFGIRLFQIEYMPVFIRDRTQPGIDGRRFDNVRFSTGIVF